MPEAIILLAGCLTAILNAYPDAVRLRLERWIVMLADQLPRRQDLRAREWLAILDELQGVGAMLWFFSACATATFQAQERKAMFALHLMIDALKAMVLGLFKFFRLSEQDVDRASHYYAPAQHGVINELFTPAHREADQRVIPEAEEAITFDLSHLPPRP